MVALCRRGCDRPPADSSLLDDRDSARCFVVQRINLSRLDRLEIFIEAQTREGYDLSFSVAITAVSAVLAVIIPPSILMIVWGGLLTVSIGALFLAGIVPGLLIGLAQMATVHVYAKARGYPTYPRSTWHQLFCATWIAIPALMTPGLISPEFLR